MIAFNVGAAKKNGNKKMNLKNNAINFDNSGAI